MSATPTPSRTSSLDVEKVDLDILRAWDFGRHRPEMFIVETLEYAPGAKQSKIPEITAAMADGGYDVYADTHINTLYVDGSRGTP